MYGPLNALWSCFHDSLYVHVPSPLPWHQWSVYYFRCDRTDAAVFSPCLTHSGRSPIFDCKIVKLHLKRNQTPKHKELLLPFNHTLTTNPKHGIYRWNSNTQVAEKGFTPPNLERSPRERPNSISGTTVELTGTTMLVDKNCTGWFLSVL